MPEPDSPWQVDPDRIAVSSYVRHHQIAADQPPALIAEVHRACRSRGAPQLQEPPPTVPIRRSVQRYYVVCLECDPCRRCAGIRGYSTAPNPRITTAPAGILPIGYPLTAPDYSARRSRTAKELGLGREQGVVAARPRTAARRRGWHTAPVG